MTASEAMALCAGIKLIHVSTIEERKGQEIYHESAPVKAVRGSENKWKVETRDQNSQKVSLMHYREESKKIF